MLKIEDSTRENGTVITLAGTVDMYASPDLKRRLDGLTEQTTARIVIDLSGVDFIDSSGLAALVGTQRRMRRYDGHLLLAAPTTRSCWIAWNRSYPLWYVTHAPTQSTTSKIEPGACTACPTRRPRHSPPTSP